MKEDKLYNIGDYKRLKMQGNSSFEYFYYKIDKSKNSSWESMEERELRLQREKVAAREVKIDLILKK